MTPKRRAVSEQLRQHIERSGLSTYRLGIDADIAPGLVSRFLNRQRSLSLDTVDRICDALDLELVQRKGRQ